QFNWTTTMLPDVNDMSEHAMIETTIYMGQAAGVSYTVLALNQNQSVLQQATLTNASQQTIWGGFTWGSGIWGGATSPLFPRAVAWPQPVVFRRMQLALQGASSAAVRVGMAHMKYEKLGYLQQSDAA